MICVKFKDENSRALSENCVEMFQKGREHGMQRNSGKKWD